MRTQLQRNAGSQTPELLLRGRRFLDRPFPLFLFFTQFHNETPNHFLHKTGRYVACQTRKTIKLSCRLLGLQTVFSPPHYLTADLKAMRTTLRQEIPHRRSVNTDDLFHTFSGLCTTLLLPSRQMSLNKHYHSDTREPNSEGHKE